MRGQYVHCLRSVTSNNTVSPPVTAGSDCSVILPSLRDLAPPIPALLVEREELDITGLAPQAPLDLGEQRPLVGAGEIATERAVLDSLESVVQAGVGHLLARPVVGDVVDQQA